MKVNFMICCDYATVQQGGAPILIGIFRGIHLQELPGRLSPFWLALEIECDPHEVGEHEFILRFVDDDGQTIYQDTLVGNFAKRPDYQPSFLYSASVIEIERDIYRAGTYRFDLIWQDQALAQLSIQIG